MSYFTILRNNKTISIMCHKCLIDELVDDENLASEIYDLWNYHNGAVREICEGHRADSYKPILDKISQIRKTYPDIMDLLRKLDLRMYAKSRFIACDLDNFGSFIAYHCDFSANRQEILFQEIKPAQVFDHQSLFPHLSLDYEILNQWSFSIEFIKYLMQSRFNFKKNARHFIKAAIIFQDSAIIDFILENGGDLNDNEYDYAMIAIHCDNNQMLKFILERGCRDFVQALAESIESDKGEMINAILAHCDFNVMTLRDKCVVVQALMFQHDTILLDKFWEAGLEITNEIMDGVNTCIVYYPVLEYLLKRGICVSHFGMTFRFEAQHWSGSRNQKSLTLLEKEGLMNFYRSSYFIKAAALGANVEIMRRLIEGIDDVVDKETLESAFILACGNSYECMLLLESHIDLSNDELLDKAMISSMKSNHSEHRVKYNLIVERLRSHGARLTNSFLILTAKEQPDFFMQLLNEVANLDINFKIATQDFMQMVTGYNYKPACNWFEDFEEVYLIEVMIFASENAEFEMVKNLIEKGAQLDCERLKKLFRSNIIIRSLEMADGLVEIGYIEQNFIEELETIEEN